jgi:signal transduction histidine kinase
MKQHGGQIAASNRIPSGAQFTLHFPIYEMELDPA